ncbi:MAG: hypothetical protein WC389_09845 [Lutibacter sp.]|jgi:hypothetical protein
MPFAENDSEIIIIYFHFFFLYQLNIQILYKISSFVAIKPAGRPTGGIEAMLYFNLPIGWQVLFLNGTKNNSNF